MNETLVEIIEKQLALMYDCSNDLVKLEKAVNYYCSSNNLYYGYVGAIKAELKDNSDLNYESTDKEHLVELLRLLVCGEE